MRHRRRAVMALLAAAAVVVLASWGGSSSGTSESTATAKELTMWTASGSPQYTWVQATLGQFTKQTGIKVNWQTYPEDGVTNKIEVALTAKSTSFDLFEDPANLAPVFEGEKGILPLNTYFSNSSETPTSFGLSDIPKNSYANCTLSGVPYCLPIFGTVPMLWYNTSEFAAAGITSPPQTIAQLVEDANKLTTGTQAGICMRGEPSQASYPAQMLLAYFLPANAKGPAYWLKSNYDPLYDTTGGVNFAKDYQQMMRHDAPQGVGAYAFTDCQNAFYQGRVAMWLDDSAISARLYNPALNPQASLIKDKIGFDVIPCPKANSDCHFSVPWGVFINRNISKPEQNAAYQLIKWITSRSIQEEAVKDNDDPSFATRKSVLTDLFSGKAPSSVPKQLLSELNSAYGAIMPNPVPKNPAAGNAGVPFQNALATLVTGSATPQQAMQAAQTQTQSVLQRAGLYTR